MRCHVLASGLGRAILYLFASVLLAGQACALEPDEILKDPALEQRARGISAELRCPVCQNQSIDDSNAPLARDLRLLVRERLIAGDTDAGVKQFLVARYGEFVLLRPPVSVSTILLWTTPALVLGLVGFMMLRNRRGRPEDAALGEAPLSEQEKAALAKLLREPGETDLQRKAPPRSERST